MDDTMHMTPEIIPTPDFSETISESVADFDVPEYGVSESEFMPGMPVSEVGENIYEEPESEVMLEQDLENEISEEEPEEITEVSVEDHLEHIQEKLGEVREKLCEEIESQREMLESGEMRDKELRAYLLMIALMLMREEKLQKKDEKGLLETAVLIIGTLMREMFVPEEEQQKKTEKASPFEFRVNLGSIGDLRTAFKKRQAAKTS